MRFYVLFILIFILQACNDKDSTCDWQGGEITDFGTYCNYDIEIIVYEDGNFMRYEAWNKDGEMLFKYNKNISTIHHWGLFLDNDMNVWMFSSDVGGSIWEKDSLTKEYRNRVFHSFLTKDSVPDELYTSSLKRFLK